MLKAIAQVWLKTDDPKYYDYIVANYDRWVNADGSINKYYVFDEYQLDHIAPGKMAAIAKVQDAETGVWYQVLDRRGQAGNYLEASGSCMFVYSTAKGVRPFILANVEMEP